MHIKYVNKGFFLLLLFVLFGGAFGKEIDSNRVTEPWDSQRVIHWYGKNGGWSAGFNYVPSYAVNTTEFWAKETFDSKVIDRELRYGSEIGFKTIRVFLQYIVWKDDPKGFKNRFNRFLDIAKKYNYKIMPVLFDDCAFGSPKVLSPYLGRQKDPIPGMILSSWTPSPGMAFKDDSLLMDYVFDVISNFDEDSAIYAWDLFNEPMHSARVGNNEFLSNLFAYIRNNIPYRKPLTIALWNDWEDKNSEMHSVNETILMKSDIISIHGYYSGEKLEKFIKKYKLPDEPIILSEWFTRHSGADFSRDLPMLKTKNVIAIQWGLVNGRTQTHFPWWNKIGDPIDKTGWFHDLLYADGTPYRQDEIDMQKKILQKEDL